MQGGKNLLVIRKWTIFSPRNLRKPLFQSRILGAVYNISCNMYKCEQNLLKDIDIYNIFLQTLYQKITGQGH